MTTARICIIDIEGSPADIAQVIACLALAPPLSPPVQQAQPEGDREVAGATPGVPAPAGEGVMPGPERPRPLRAPRRKSAVCPRCQRHKNSKFHREQCATLKDVPAPGPAAASPLADQVKAEPGVCPRCHCAIKSAGHQAACLGATGDHTHHFLFESPNGEKSVGKCACGATQELPNAWSRDVHPNGQPNIRLRRPK